jgi:hypothetical protein
MKCGHRVAYVQDFANQFIPLRPDGCVICERDELESKLDRGLRQAFLDGALASRWIKPTQSDDYHTCCEKLADAYVKQEPPK